MFHKGISLKSQTFMSFGELFECFTKEILKKVRLSGFSDNYLNVLQRKILEKSDFQDFRKIIWMFYKGNSRKSQIFTKIPTFTSPVDRSSGFVVGGMDFVGLDHRERQPIFLYLSESGSLGEDSVLLCHCHSGLLRPVPNNVRYLMGLGHRQRNFIRYWICLFDWKQTVSRTRKWRSATNSTPFPASQDSKTPPDAFPRPTTQKDRWIKFWL